MRSVVFSRESIRSSQSILSILLLAAGWWAFLN
jgi:hypothetical protein